MSTTHICRTLPWFVALSVGMALGCTVDESDGSGGGKSCPDVRISSSAISSASTGYGAPFKPPSTGTGDGWLSYPDCPPGVALLNGGNNYGSMSDVKMDSATVDFDYFSYIQIDAPPNEFIFLTWTAKVSSGGFDRYVEGKPGELLHVTGAWRPADHTQIQAIEPGSTATFFENPSTGEPDLVYFHIFLYPEAEYVGCMHK